MSMTLFDFEVEPVEKVQIEHSEEEVIAAFRGITSFLKENGNPFYPPAERLVEGYIKDNQLETFVPYFKERGWINNSYHPNTTLLEYHTVDEVIEKVIYYYDDLIGKVINGYDMSGFDWHKETWRYVSEKIMPKNLAPNFEQTKELKRLIYIAEKQLQKDLAIELGWKHLKESEASRGSKMGKFLDKPYKKHFVPYFTQRVLEINDYDEMAEFVSRPFFMGRWDWWSGKDYTLPPRPNFEKLSLTPLQIAALTEADQTNVKEIINVILEYCGGGCGGDTEELVKIANFPPTFTWEDYQQSLSEEDHFILIDDHLRLKKMHGR